MTVVDAKQMKRALTLARKGIGKTSPNPAVGCVIVKNGTVVGEGWHKKAGGPHAEVHALEIAGDAARGADVYVTLEPCCHSGKTPPCSEALIKAGVSGKKLETVYPPAIDGSQPRESVYIRAELAVSPTTRLVTMVGRITRPKGQVEFVRAAKLVLAVKSDVVFLIVGDSVAGSFDDTYKAELEREVRAMNDPRIRMLGMRHDVLGIVAESDSVVFPSLWPEGFGLAVAEAMELGRPVIATTTGGTAEMIEDGVTGLRFSL